MLTPAQKNALAQHLASTMGTALRQSWKQIDGVWWLHSFDVPKRALTDDEVAWHVARNHKPFVVDGIGTEHPDWWKVPE